MPGELYINFNSVPTKVASDNADFLKYLKDYFAVYYVSSLSKADLTITVNFQSGYSTKMTHQLPASVEVWLGEKVGYSPSQKTFYFIHHEIQGSLRFEQSGEWRVEVNFKKNLFKHAANSLLYSQQGQTHYYRLIARLIVQNLLFIKLQLQKPVSILSAAAVVVRNRCRMVSGK
jgi:hypothetical protein